MFKKLFISSVMMFVLGSGVSFAQDYAAKVKDSMNSLKTKLNALGEPKLDGTSKVAGKDRPLMYFGSTKINTNYKVVDEVKKEHGGTATVFVKEGEEFIRVSTNVMKDGESRAIGTPLARNAAYEQIVKGSSFFGKVEILGTPHETGYEPIKNSKGEILGIYYVGYPLK